MAIDMNRTTIALPGQPGFAPRRCGRLPYHRPCQRRRPEGHRRKGRRSGGGLRGVCRARTRTHESSQKVVSTLNFVQKAKDGSRFSTHCRLYSGALSGTRTLGPLIKSQLLYQLS